MGWYGRSRGYGSGDGYGRWAPYVPVAKRRANAAAHAARLAKKQNRQLVPVKIEGRTMAHTYWGRAWCDNLEAYSDFANRLPRGKTYARNGSVIDLQIKSGKIEALVSGSQIYTVVVSISALGRSAWDRLKQDCSSSISSLIDLLQGKFDEGVMRRLAHRTEGLFPQPKEIKMKCSCPDYATLCKHVAAVLYGVGNRLDAAPELLFALRNVDHLELISKAMAEENLSSTLGSGSGSALEGADLGEMFGIELDETTTETTQEAAPQRKGRGSRAKQAVSKEPAEPETKSPRGSKSPRAATRPANAVRTIPAKMKAAITAAGKTKSRRTTTTSKSPRKAK